MRFSFHGYVLTTTLETSPENEVVVNGTCVQGGFPAGVGLPVA